MKIVAMKKCADGNAEIGEMWTETKIFDSTATLEEVMRWAPSGTSNQNYRRNVILSLPDGEKLEFRP